MWGVVKDARMWGVVKDARIERVAHGHTYEGVAHGARMRVSSALTQLGCPHLTAQPARRCPLPPADSASARGFCPGVPILPPTRKKPRPKWTRLFCIAEMRLLRRDSRRRAWRSGRWRQPTEWRTAPGRRPESASYPSRRDRFRWRRYRWRRSSPDRSTKPD